MLTELLITILILSLIIFYIKCVRPHSHWERMGVLQGPSVWLLGEFWRVLLGQESYSESVMRIYKKFPNVRYFGTYQFNTPLLVIRDIELIKKIGIKDFEHFVDRRMMIPDSVDPLWGTNLFSLTGQKWKDMRMLLSPAFTSSKMKNIFTLMQDTADVFVKHFEEKPHDVIELNFKEVLNRFTCDAIATTAFGIEINSLKNPKNEFYQVGMEFTDFTGWRSLLFWSVFILPDFIMKAFGMRIYSEKITNFFIGIVDEAIKIRKEKGIVRPDVIQLLMEFKKGKQIQDEENVVDTGFATAKSYFSNKVNVNIDLTNTDIAAQASVFFFGGFDEISTELRFLVYEFAVNPDIQNKLRNEINETFEKCHGNLTYAALMEMKYMDMVVSEVLRKWPSNGNLERLCTKPYTIPALHPDEKDITIEVGTLLWIPIMGIHYDPVYFPDPDKFDPERFSGLNSDKLNSSAYLPFGIGPRNCIGSRFSIMEVKVLFFNVLRKFEIIPVKKSKIPIKISRNNFSLDGNSFWFGLKKLNIRK